MNVPATVVIEYTNYRGERSERRISPSCIRWDTNNKYHGAAWILHALDYDKNVMRDFALASIHSWKEPKP